MCGITGIFDTRSTRSIDRGALSRMNDAQHHRGPDEGSLHLEPGLGFGHRRLSIIDVATGQQPLFNEDGSVVIVFNGEIYNYQDLMPELQALGHVFHTRSDTEVIVHAWEAWGEKCVERLRGMFAFALWDRNRQTLFMARDRMGVKPMFYAALDDAMMLFGSELKSLLAYTGSGGGLKRDIDPLAIEEYFALGYVAEPRSIFRQVRKLPPAHLLVWRRGEPEPQPRPYWDLRFTLDNPIGLEEACAELQQRLRESVRLRMISEVPLGAFLSGGVDSSAVVAVMAGLQDSPVRTCSIGFDDPLFNESAFAQTVAERYRTDHHLEVVSSDDFGLVDTLAHLYDEPYADSSAIPTYRVCQLARKRVTVALSGDGGDESFGGYRRYRMHLMEERMRSALPAGVRQPLFGLLGRLYPKADWAPRALRAKTTFEGMARSSVQAYFHSVSILRAPMRAELFSPALKRELGGYDAQQVFDRHAAKAGTDDALALIQYLDLKTYLVGDINTKVDRASMAHSLEVREPLMDHPLLEWLATLPSHLKVRGQEGKFLLKKAMEPALPNDILYRPKMGFAVPLARWFRGPLRERVQTAVLGERLLSTGWFNEGYLRHLVQAHQSGARDYSAPLWTLLMFEAFLRNSIDGSGGRTGCASAHGCRGDSLMRVLHVLDHSIPLHSGYTFRTLSILREQRRLGWETFHLTSPKHTAPSGPEEQVDGWHFYRTMASQGSRLPGMSEVALMKATQKRLLDVARQVRPDVLHAHSPVLNAIPALRVGRQLGIPVVYEVRAFWEDAAVDHGTTQEGSLRYRLTRQLETHALRRASHVFTICEGLRADIVARGIPAERVTVIPNAVDIEAFELGGVADQHLKAQLGLSGATVVGFIGSFYAYEGLDLLLQALPVLLRRRPDVRVLLVGGGPQESALKTQALSLGVADKVVFAGRVPHDEVQRYYDLIDVLAYPRHSMRLTELVTPLKPLEAMAQGRLFVASDVGGHKELIQHGRNGCLFRAGSPDSLCDALDTLLARPESWADLRRGGREFVEQERNWKTSAAGYPPVFARLT